ncbi:MAG: GIY-YIG nuclease family protein [Patescibacteria group bacterium]
MYYTYVLKSLSNSDLYVGSTENIEQRLHLHNTGRVRSTKAYRPWIMLENKPFKTRSEAQSHEYFLKSGQQKEILRKKYC